MASPLSAALCALIGTAFWTVLGYAIARHLLPRVLALGAAPVIGWAAFSTASLPVLTLIGFSPRSVAGVAALCLAMAGVSLLRPLPANSDPALAVRPWWFAAAGLLALAPTLAVLPKYSAQGVYLAAAIFDHAKIAIIDAMMRQGLPPVNPVFAAPGAAGRLDYYYLWHFSAAELALPLQTSGWEADIGLTWFTAFASLCLLMAVAVWLSKRTGAAALVLALAAGASLHAALGLVFDDSELAPFLQPPIGFAGWLFQSAWVPQHLMAASCAVAAMVLLAHYAEQQKAAYVPALALIVAAGFESSAFVGGVTFAIAAAIAAPLLLGAIDAKRRLAAALGLAVSALFALCIAAPFIRDQFALLGERQGGGVIGFNHFEVLGTMFPPALRRLLDLPAYWLILLPVEFPAVFIAGVLSLAALLRRADKGPQGTAVKLFAVLVAAGLAIPWLLASRIGDNNDLALRAVLPANLILIAATAAGLLMRPGRALATAIVIAACGGLVLSLPDSTGIILNNLRGNANGDGAIFAQTPELWRAVRRYAGVNARVANNPLFLQDLTPWPVNLSWALLADRSSCFAGREMALAFAALPPAQREAINAQFIRIFAGQGAPSDVDALAAQYGCDVIVLVPQDGGWLADPFADSADYRLVEKGDRWRIYVRSRSN